MSTVIRSMKFSLFELVVAAALWGFGFICVVWSLKGMGPLSVTGWRFVIAAVIGLVLISFSTQLRSQLSYRLFWLALVPGIFLCANILLQTWGLAYTTATKSGFITTLYVIIVPLLERVWLKKKLPRYHILFTTLALAGSALICDLHTGAVLQLNFGDFLTFLCAIAASFQIIWCGRVQGQIDSALVFNSYQSFWAGIGPLLLALWFEPWPNLTMSNFSGPGFIMLVIGPTMIAFMLQLRVQKVIRPSVASLLFLLESPIAAGLAIWLLGESLMPMQWVGAGLILASSILCTVVSDHSG